MVDDYLKYYRVGKTWWAALSGGIRGRQESNWRICLDENQFSREPQERLLWLPHNRIIASDERLMFFFLGLMSTMKNKLGKLEEGRGAWNSKLNF